MRRLALVVSVVVLVPACSSGGRAESERTPTSRTSSVASAPTTVSATTEPSSPAFDWAVSGIDEATRARMPYSWRPGCPVPLEELRLLTLEHWGYDGVEHQGELVVHADQAQAVVGAFRALFDAGFPIERMQLVDAYGGDDFASTASNNTAAFNCRSVVGKPGSWSEHAYGRAIDVNPLVNPYLGEPRLRDPRLVPYLDRSLDAPGMIRAGDVVVAAFAAVGWKWGGAWPTPDYQHFSATGR
jgi:D-alanyl-D-alanine carboxypeptidase